jgi:tripartite ATP-independent transporter DctM subunit
MDPLTVGILGIICLLVFLSLGVHIGVALGFVGFLGSSFIVGVDASMWGSVNAMYYKLASFELITVPLFVIMGFLASAGELSTNIFGTLRQWIGNLRGGLGIATVFSCTIFGTICGSSLVTASVFSMVAAPQMRKQGYDKRLAYGICASSGLIGMLIPPSILMVVYGYLSGLSVGKLLVGGITPGLLLTVLYSLTILTLVKLRPELIGSVPLPQATFRQKILDLIKLWPILIVALVIFVGIFGGVFNPTEAAAVATFVILILLFYIKRSQSWGLLWSSIKDTGKTSAMIFLIMGSASIFSQFLVLSGITEKVAEFIIGLGLSRWSFVIFISIIYLVMGCFLDSISMLSITIPLFNPVLPKMGIDPFWYAMVVIMAIEIGMITPPVGLCVYGAKAVAEPDVTLEDVFGGMMPFFWASMIALLIMIAFPQLSLILPALMK